MDQPEKPSIDQIIIKSFIGGIVWGMVWGLIYYALLTFSGRYVPFAHALIFGSMFGSAFGFINGLLLVMAGGKQSVSLVLVILFSCGATLMSPSFDFFLANIIAVVLGAWAISDFALKTKTSDYIPRRKEKRKNG